MECQSSRRTPHDPISRIEAERIRSRAKNIIIRKAEDKAQGTIANIKELCVQVAQFQKLSKKDLDKMSVTLALLEKNYTKKLFEMLHETIGDSKEVHKFAALLAVGIAEIGNQPQDTLLYLQEIENEDCNTINILNLRNDVRTIEHTEKSAITRIKKERFEEVKRYVAIINEIEEKVINRMYTIADRMCEPMDDNSMQIHLHIKNHLTNLFKIICHVRNLSIIFTQGIEEIVAQENCLTSQLAFAYHNGVTLAQSSGMEAYGIAAKLAYYAINKGKEASVYIAQGLWNQAKVTAPIVGQGLWKVTKTTVPIIGEGIWKATKITAPIIGKAIVEIAKINYYLAKKSLEVIEHNLGTSHATADL
ncbi:hypothetical protein [Candidatus Cardinium hertigii]|uniref:hypothetical protein n=1 Tax=Candidatus Cardinium hertigii TaxID=247481 RepID=UPI0013A5A5B0|nr:hypothetical protein [Candidatus Cardinium hertigii]